MGCCVEYVIWQSSMNVGENNNMGAKAGLRSPAHLRIFVTLRPLDLQLTNYNDTDLQIGKDRKE